MARVRVVIAEDQALLRQLVSEHLRHNGIDVLAETADGARLLAAVRTARPDVAIIDIKLGPESDVDGMSAAMAIRRELPEVGVLLLSQYREVRFFTTLVKDGMRKAGYLLKEGATGAGGFVAAVERIAAGGYVVDPAISALMLKGRSHQGLDGLTPRQLEVLALMAEGLNNGAIGARMNIKECTVETHIRAMFANLGIQDVPEINQRVVAVLMYLRARQGREG
ncbi:response regulator transcription factor [Allorhizocola rhizosphaerae]|uniref:response regulator transcription factor n=1 Tax=Allorhizocola rhizosphaerae TaxID=1872709 RepID=UPI000E3DBB06|nr:response regulator transcription factor [Allorhizocola rhizosphaerae]